MRNTLPKIHLLDKPAQPDCFGISNSPIGYFLMAWQDDMLVMLKLLPAHAEKQLKLMLPEYHLSAKTKQDDARAKALVKNILFPANEWSGHPPKDLKIGFYGTSFQHNILNAMMKITKGHTVSYGELAFKAGQARAARAVGTVCSKNPVAFIVPCHRIVASNGGLGGYGYGTALKRQLLDWEKPR